MCFNWSSHKSDGSECNISWPHCIELTQAFSDSDTQLNVSIFISPYPPGYSVSHRDKCCRLSSRYWKFKKKQLQPGNKLLRLNVHTGSRRSLMIYLEPECSSISDEKSIFWLEDDISEAFLLADLSAAVMWPHFRKQSGGVLCQSG